MRKLKFMLAAALGFSAACSSVKNAPKQKSDDKQQLSEAVTDTVSPRPRIVVMYGVQRPGPERQSQQRMERMAPDSITPVLERPADDMPAGSPAEK